MKICRDYSLKKYNTFHVEARCKFFAELSTADELRELVESSEFAGYPSLILGDGANMLFSKDFDGLIIYPNFKGILKISEDADSVLLEVAVGENWHSFVEFCVSNNYYGLENLALIPSKVGAAPVQNLGAYGVEQKDCFHSLTGFHLSEKKFLELKYHDCRFEYRNSIFKKELQDIFVVTSVVYKLNKIFAPKLEYKELANEFSAVPIEQITARQVFEAVCRIRKRKLPDVEVIGSAGSFFKNPVMNADEYSAFHELHPEVSAITTEIGNFKIPAARLIEQCGWKGKRLGDAGVYANHALIIVNHGKASGKEILALANEIEASVCEKFGISLEKEVRVV